MPGMALSLKRLRKLPDEELIRLHDEQAKNTVVGTEYYENELARRQQRRHAAIMTSLTKRIAILTYFVTVATAVNTGLFIWDKLDSL